MTSTRGTTFHEEMDGTTLLRGEQTARLARMELNAAADTVLRPLGSTTAQIKGRLRIDGWADDPHAVGTLEIAPVSAHRIRYRIAFTAHDGSNLVLDGWKTLNWRRPLQSMTTLPYTLRPDTPAADSPRTPLGTGVLRFRMRTLAPFLASWRFPRQPANPAQEPTHATQDAEKHLFAPRARPETGRGHLQVWYTTLTDPDSGTGVWLHHETVTAPGSGEPHALGWAAVFPPEQRPTLARFGPLPPHGPTAATPDKDHTAPTAGFHAGNIEATARRLKGSAGEVSWDLTIDPGSGPTLYTFPRTAWERRLLPAAQILPQPTATYTGTIHYSQHTLHLNAAPGGSARIEGRGHAKQWGWLHADLGNGNVLEVVAAVSNLPVLRALPPLVFLRLRCDGRDWPRGPWRTALGCFGVGRFRSVPALPRWTVSGRVGLQRIRIEIDIPPASTLTLDYADPDGRQLVCHNSERANARVVWQRWRGHWNTERTWQLKGTAHAEVGGR